MTQATMRACAGCSEQTDDPNQMCDECWLRTPALMRAALIRAAQDDEWYASEAAVELRGELHRWLRENPAAGADTVGT